jgi:hypothetical protein
MGEDTGILPGLPAVAGKPVHVGFDGGRLTSDGGILLLAAIEQRLKIGVRRSLRGLCRQEHPVLGVVDVEQDAPRHLGKAVADARDELLRRYDRLAAAIAAESAAPGSSVH